MIAAKLLVPEQEGEDGVDAAAHLWAAVQIVVIADIVMSLDNVIAVAAAANGSIPLLVIGLAISVPLIVAGAALIMALLTRCRPGVGRRGLLGWIAGEVMATDPAIQPSLHASSTVRSGQARWAAQLARHRAAVCQWRPWRRGDPRGARHHRRARGGLDLAPAQDGRAPSTPRRRKEPVLGPEPRQSPAAPMAPGICNIGKAGLPGARRTTLATAPDRGSCAAQASYRSIVFLLHREHLA